MRTSGTAFNNSIFFRGDALEAATAYVYLWGMSFHPPFRVFVDWDRLVVVHTSIGLCHLLPFLFGHFGHMLSAPFHDSPHRLLEVRVFALQLLTSAFRLEHSYDTFHGFTLICWPFSLTLYFLPQRSITIPGTKSACIISYPFPEREGRTSRRI